MFIVKLINNNKILFLSKYSLTNSFPYEFFIFSLLYLHQDISFTIISKSADKNIILLFINVKNVIDKS